MCLPSDCLSGAARRGSPKQDRPMLEMSEKCKLKPLFTGPSSQGYELPSLRFHPASGPSSQNPPRTGLGPTSLPHATSPWQSIWSYRCQRAPPKILSKRNRQRRGTFHENRFFLRPKASLMSKGFIDDQRLHCGPKAIH